MEPTRYRPNEADVSALHQDLLDKLNTSLREDAGPAGDRDITGKLLPPDRLGHIRVRARDPGVWCGLATLAWVADLARQRNRNIDVTWYAHDGDAAEPSRVAAELAGPLPLLLIAERSVLNLLGFLSGIATLTRKFVDACAGTNAKICDTRKTLPGYRQLSKYAVRCGGGHNHRLGLHDAVLIKDNHLAHLAGDQLASTLAEWIQRARDHAPAFVQVEVDNLDQLHSVLTIEGVDMVLLDNFEPDWLLMAVQLRDGIAPHVLLEASGRARLDTVRTLAESGVDRISVGALTHSAPALDIGFDHVVK